MYRSPSPLPYAPPGSPYAPPGSPYAPPGADPYGSPYPAQPSSAQINPGSITYTTSTGPDGRIVYHPFKAVPASYQTPTGVVSGIQWVPAEATQILPAGAQPATPEFAAAWNRGSFNNDEQRALKEWQRGEDKRRRKEEKESARILREKQARNDDMTELRFARERDAVNRERRKSFNAGGPPQYAFPGAGAPGAYPSNATPYGAPGAPGYPGSQPGGYVSATASPNLDYARERRYSQGGGILTDVEKQFAGMGLDGGAADLTATARTLNRKYSTHESMAERARRLSGNYGPERPLSSYGATPGVATSAGAYGAPPRSLSRNEGVYPDPTTVPAGYVPPRPLSRNGGYPDNGAYGVPPRPLSRNGGYPDGTTGAYTAPPRPLSRNAGSMYGAPGYTNPSPNLRSADPQAAFAAHAPGHVSPYHAGGGADPYLRSTSPLPVAGNTYPPGHVLEGHSISSRSRATTPIHGLGQPLPPSFPPAGAYSSHVGQGGALASPECFQRPINAGHSYTPFETMKIMDMDGFLDSIPRMPAVLQPHDVYAEDWNRLMEDMALAWAGKLPIPIPPDGHMPKRTTLASNLIDLWNTQFFERRGVEIVLYKGRERRSGPRAGAADLPMPSFDDYDSPSSSSSSSEDSDDDYNDPRHAAQPYGGYYGRPPSQYGHPDGEARRAAAKAEKKRRKKEKKIRKKARAREKRYALYLTSVPVSPGGADLSGGPGHVGSLAGMHSPNMGYVPSAGYGRGF